MVKETSKEAHFMHSENDRILLNEVGEEISYE
uniref:Uncharacterized protein n=1 Tax=Rhizophora mucronata TaxID=61149 RepID=A0A2P2PU75_RHIMU